MKLTNKYDLTKHVLIQEDLLIEVSGLWNDFALEKYPACSQSKTAGLKYLK